MAAKYHVKLRGKVHGPFTSAQLKQLAGKGQITKEAEIRQVGADKWYPATRVAGLFDGGGSSGASGVSKGSGKPKTSSGKSKRPARRKAKPVVDASSVFDLEDDEEEELDDVEFFEDEEYDEPEFVDDDPYEARPSRSSRRSSRRSRGGGGTSWGQVRTGLLLVAIGVCILAGSFAMQALAELIFEPMMASAITGGRPPGSRSTEKLLRMLIKGSIFTAPIGNVVMIVGFSLAVFLPTQKAAKGLAIAALATLAVHTVMHFVYVVAPAVDDGVSMGFGRFAFSTSSNDFPIEFVLTWFPLFASLVLTSLTLSSVGAVKNDHRFADSALANVWFIGIFAGIYVVGWIIGQVWEPSGRGMGESAAKALIWLMVLLRLGHISVYGVYIGRLIPQSFWAKDLV